MTVAVSMPLFPTYRLRIVSEAQYGLDAKGSSLALKFGPTFSSIGKRLAIHPKLLVGFSQTKVDYQSIIEIRPLLFGDTQWSADSGSLRSSRFVGEWGATFELILNNALSLLTDVSSTYQSLFEFNRSERYYQSYAEFSPGIKIAAPQKLAFLAGLSIPYNPQMSRQLPIQYFAQINTSIAASGKGKN
jgi:hypothetical protein